MMKPWKKSLAVMMTSILMLSALAACGGGKSDSSSEPANTAPTNASVKETSGDNTEKADEQEAESQGKDLLDSKGWDGMEASDWEKVRLSRKDFKAMLDELGKPAEDGEESPFKNVTMVDDQTIEFVIDTAEAGGELGVGLMTGLFDPIIRQLYVHSAYYKNDKQPLIRFLDTDGNVLKENSEPLQTGQAE
ncbi:hypothetical protein EHV15_27905 [Paenibacillus oralis]|uniref:Lipoprotein n=1 Tax=Paenibacillus oralis TaxID=2490856 RepID=A0A3P3U818_9BACL|nr:hypothetical protein [Paenibacillus oralis]RRJ66314.1 hypothetical protein EHV15_27905 [Paenibacillus oralis]